MALLEIKVDDKLKEKADLLFNELGLDTTTAVQLFLKKAVETRGIPFMVQHEETEPSAQLLKAIQESKKSETLFGPFEKSSDAVDSMLED